LCGNSHRTSASPFLIRTDIHDSCQLI
jgi:hypothetical protein